MDKPPKATDSPKQEFTIADEHRHIVVAIILGGLFIIFTTPYVIDRLAAIAGIDNWENVISRDWVKIWTALIYALMGLAMGPFTITMREYRTRKKAEKLRRLQEPKIAVPETNAQKKNRLTRELKALRGKFIKDH